jgi:hypothetical protein
MIKRPHVTQVLWSWQNFSGISPDVLEAAADRGVRVHALCAAIAKGLWLPEVPEDCQGFVSSFENWFKKAVQEVVMVEQELHDPVHRFTGTPDLICLIKGDKKHLTLVDIKTPLAESKTWRLQLSAYKWLAVRNNHLFPLPIERIISLRLSKEGKAAKVLEYSKTANHDFAIFLSCLTAWRYFNGEE